MTDFAVTPSLHAPAKHGADLGPPSQGDVDFDCTCCGRCCHDLKLPLTVNEAIDWLGNGHVVQVLCDAVPWPAEPASGDLRAASKRQRSFEARSGSLPVRVEVVLTAAFAGACPHLQADMRCGQYERRPLVCRIYPAEINALVALQPAQKACPDVAWASGQSPLLRQGVLVDAALHALILQSRAATVAEAGPKAALCAALGLTTAAMANEGYAVHTPDAAALRSALQSLAVPLGPAAWRFVSNQQATVQALRDVGAEAEAVSDAPGACGNGLEYIGFHRATG